MMVVNYFRKLGGFPHASGEGDYTLLILIKWSCQLVLIATFLTSHNKTVCTAAGDIQWFKVSTIARNSDCYFLCTRERVRVSYLMTFESIGSLLMGFVMPLMPRIISQQFYCVLLGSTAGPHVLLLLTGTSESYREIWSLSILEAECVLITL